MEETGPSVENGIGNKNHESREDIKILKVFFNYIESIFLTTRETKYSCCTVNVRLCFYKKV